MSLEADLRRLEGEGPAELPREAAHMGPELVFRQSPRRARVHVLDHRPGSQADAGRRAGIVAARVHHDLRSATPERRGQRRDVDVLAPGVRLAEHGQRAGVLGDHGDPHAVISSSR